MKQKNLIAICFDVNNKPYKYKYKLVENSRSLVSFENFCRNKYYKCINYYDKDTGAFWKQKKL